jgi:FkbM family methyltransferase
MADIPATEDDVRAAYRVILGREPDAGGFEHHCALVARGDLTTRQLRTSFLNSVEYLNNEVGTTVDIGGVVAVVDPNEPDFGRHIAADHTWERHIVETIVALLPVGGTFVDVGANVGIMSFHAARKAGPRGRVIAFEPDERNAQSFLHGALENGFADRIRLHRFALSDGPGIFALQGGANAYLSRPDQAVRLAQAIAGDELLAGEPRIDLIKIDIEGHEPHALTGLRKTIKRLRPCILCEFNPRCLTSHIGAPPEAFAKQLFDLASEITVIEHDGRENVVSVPEDLMALWETRNREAVQAGFLPDGMLHFDLLLSVR